MLQRVKPYKFTIVLISCTYILGRFFPDEVLNSIIYALIIGLLILSIIQSARKIRLAKGSGPFVEGRMKGFVNEGNNSDQNIVTYEFFAPDGTPYEITEVFKQEEFDSIVKKEVVRIWYNKHDPSKSLLIENVLNSAYYIIAMVFIFLTAMLVTLLINLG